jgi:flagellar biosynthesis component FlhA
MKLLNVEIGLVCVMLIIFKVPQFYAKFSSLCLWRIKYSGKKSSSSNIKAVKKQQQQQQQQQQQKAAAATTGSRKQQPATVH